MDCKNLEKKLESKYKWEYFLKGSLFQSIGLVYIFISIGLALGKTFMFLSKLSYEFMDKKNSNGRKNKSKKKK